ncbi:zinc knuckle CX2CX4HX4C containing protein [Tanacetum coccineum]|uniref:Zinc knuckle CX2CX4HX4C containing protein n=1 Tax=Tanacetum coccineum TaxID=301880 RepID=A0ABQ5B3W8_9ASTR
MGYVDRVVEASEPAYSTKASTSTTVAHVQSRKARSQKGKSATHASTFSSKGKEHLFDEDDEMEMDIGLSQDHEVNEVLQIHDDQGYMVMRRVKSCSRVNIKVHVQERAGFQVCNKVKLLGCWHSSREAVAGDNVRVSTLAGRSSKNPNHVFLSFITNPGVGSFAAEIGELVRDVVDGVASDDCIMSMNGDVITELFDVSLSTPKDIDAFTSDLELGKYRVWSELTREKRQEVMNTIWSIWNTLVAETFIETNANPMPSKVLTDPIVQSVSIEKTNSYMGAAVGSEPKTSKSKANFHSLFSKNVCEGAKFSIPKKVVETVSTRFDHTIYGYFIGKRIAFLVVEYYACNNWGKYGLTRIMMKSKGFFFFKFKSSKGLDDVMENGPWMIRNSPIILKKWSIDTCLCKEELTYIPAWVKIHDRSSFARCLIEIDVKDVLKESLTMGVPLIKGMGYTIETVTVEYEWKPPRCDLCKIFGHVHDHCPKKVSSPPTVVTSNIVTSIVEKTNDGFQTVGKKKKGKSKSTNGGQFVGLSVKQNLRYDPKATTSIPKKGATNAGNASKSSSMLKTTGTSSEKGKFTTSNPYYALDDESEEDVENVYDESTNLFPNSKTGGSSSFKAAVG